MRARDKWLLGALLLAVAGARRIAPAPQPLPAPGPTPAPGAGQVPARLTPATAAQVAGAIVRALTRIKGQLPASTSSWLFPLALAANETASFSQLYNWNVGNVLVVGTHDWFANPHVTVPLRFADCTSLDDGALMMLRVLDRFGGLAAADAGDLAAFQVALNGYLGGGTYPSIAALVASLGAVVPAA